MHCEPKPSSAFPFDSKFLQVNGSKLHYIDCGEGKPIIFLHGVPTSSYLWRNIIPILQPQARCIALDLIGFGKSDKPNIAYTISDHIDYVNQFIESLQLQEVTFVLHGWGSVIGLNYFRQFPENTKAIAFYEAHIHQETDWNSLSLPVQQLAAFMRNPKQIERAIIRDNYLLQTVLPMSMLHLPDPAVMDFYNEPFTSYRNRRPLLQYLNDLPLGNNDTAASEIIAAYSTSLMRSSIPKLMLYTVPGFLTPIETVQWCSCNLPNIELADLGEELHFAQETMPHFFGQILRDWFNRVHS